MDFLTTRILLISENIGPVMNKSYTTAIIRVIVKSLVAWKINLRYMEGRGGDDLPVCQLWILDGRTVLDPWAFEGVNPAVAFPNSTADCMMLVYSEVNPGIHRIRPPIIPPLQNNGHS